MNRTRATRIVLYAALIFGAGAITGAFVAPHLGRAFMRPPRPEQMAEHMMDRLRGGLDLTPEQAARIKPLIEKTGQEMETIRKETTRRVFDRIAETNEEITSFLTPEQRTKFQRMEVEHRQRLQLYHPLAESPGPPPPPGP